MVRWLGWFSLFGAVLGFAATCFHGPGSRWHPVLSPLLVSPCGTVTWLLLGDYAPDWLFLSLLATLIILRNTVLCACLVLTAWGSVWLLTRRRAPPNSG